MVVVVAAVAMVAAACGSSGSKKASSGGGKTVTIGFVGAKTGDNANLGINIRDGVKVAITEENAKKDGTTIALKEFDTAGDPAQATTIAPQFIQDTSIVGTVGPAFSGETKALIPLYQDAGLVMISPSATNVKLPDVVPNETVFHRDIADDALQASGIATYLAQSAKPKSVAYVNDNSEYGKGLADQVQKLSTEKGIKAATTQVVDPKAQDFSATVTAVKSSGADLVFYGGYYAEAGRLRKQLVDSGVKGTFISGDGSLDPGFITAAGAADAEGAKLTCPCDLAFATSTGKLKTFYDDFKKEIGKEPGLYSPEAYDAAKILIEGIKKGDDTRAKLLNFVSHGVGTYDGISKSISFQPNGDVKSTEFFVFQVKDGKIAPGEVIQAAVPETTTTAAGATTTAKP
jgi:branched-chain amino acid transport system substrate-binding protein